MYMDSLRGSSVRIGTIQRRLAYVCMYMYVYIYIYRERERKRDAASDTIPRRSCAMVSSTSCDYIYIYIYICIYKYISIYIYNHYFQLGSITSGSVLEWCSAVLYAQSAN